MQAASPTPCSGYAPIGPLRMFYTIRGAGDPIVLIHGGLGSSCSFSQLAPKLAATRQVITVDLQGHGRTADIERPLACETMADDIKALLEHLRLQAADVLGYSVGGEVAQRLAIDHPGSVRKLIVVSAAYSRSGYYPEILAQKEGLDERAAQRLKQTDLYEAYCKLAPRRDDWALLCGKLGAMFRRDYDWADLVAQIEASTLLVFGDCDLVRTRHAEEFYELLGGGRRDGGWDGSGVPQAHLAVLPAQTHYTILDSPLLATVVGDFLRSPALRSPERRSQPSGA